MILRNGDWIQTYSRRRFYPLDPRAEEVYIEDIARGLSMCCRFAGQIREFYSVAQHSVFVSQHCDPKDALHGLLHDASEAYIIDLPRPIKRDPAFAFYREAEKQIMRAIWEAFGLTPDEPESVHKADGRALATEARDLFIDGPLDDWTNSIEPPCKTKIRALSPEAAEHAFLQRFAELYRR